jgi:hypothetical protein
LCNTGGLINDVRDDQIDEAPDICRVLDRGILSESLILREYSMHSCEMVINRSGCMVRRSSGKEKVNVRLRCLCSKKANNSCMLYSSTLVW